MQTIKPLYEIMIARTKFSPGDGCAYVLKTDHVRYQPTIYFMAEGGARRVTYRDVVFRVSTVYGIEQLWYTKQEARNIINRVKSASNWAHLFEFYEMKEMSAH